MPLKLPRVKVAYMHTVDLLLNAEVKDGNTNLEAFSLEMAFKDVGLVSEDKLKNLTLRHCLEVRTRRKIH